MPPEMDTPQPDENTSNGDHQPQLLTTEHGNKSDNAVMSRWRRFSNTDRIIGLIGIVIGLIGIVLAYYFYRQSTPSARPTYQISDEPAVVYSSTDVDSEIQVLDSSGKLVTSNVYVASVTFWNAGELGIEWSDVRVPVRLRLSFVKRILKSSVVRQSLPDSTNFRVQSLPMSSADPGTAEVELLWDHLDPNKGAVVQVMYESDQPAKIDITGYIYRVPIETFVDATPQIEKKPLPYQLIIYGLATIIYLFTIRTLSRFARKQYKNRLLRFAASELQDAKMVTGVAFLVGITIASFGVSLAYILVTPKPPI